MNASRRTRVVITGLGCVTPIGEDVESTWRSMVEGVSGVGPITRFDATDYSTRIAAEVTGFDPSRHFGAEQIERMDRFVQLGLVAARQATADAGLTVAAAEAHRVGVVGGSAFGGFEIISDQFRVLHHEGADRISPFLATMMSTDRLPASIAADLGLLGPGFGIVSACATSGHAIGEAAEIIKRGDAEVMLACGSEGGVAPIEVAAFGSMRALSTRNDEPSRASRPFDAQRDGFVIGEGSAVLVLESLDHARARGARIHAELVGYGATADAYHVSAPPDDGEGAVRSMLMALRSAGLGPADVDYVNAHGTSTPHNDRIETVAIKTAFGRAANDVAISSTKSVTGHMLGAAGAVEAVACIMAISTGCVPPTTNYEQPDPACDLDYVPNVARRQRVEIALSNSFGFGGHNSTLVLAALRD